MSEFNQGNRGNENEPMGIASMVMGILSLVTGCSGVGILLAILGLIFGIISRAKCKNAFAVAGIVTSVIGLIISIPTFILIGLTIFPFFLI